MFQVVPGPVEDIGDVVIEEADYVAFTGSTDTGRRIGAKAGAALIGCSLELGGKNPMIVLADADADLDRVIAALPQAVCLNAGQVCMAIERIYVHSSRYEEFISRAVDRFATLRLGFALDFSTDVGSLTSKAVLERVRTYVEEARAAGATVLTGGRARLDLGPYFFEPTLLANVPDRALLTREEVFGPVCAVYPFDDEADAVKLANDKRVRTDCQRVDHRHRTRHPTGRADHGGCGEHQRRVHRRVQRRVRADGRHEGLWARPPPRAGRTASLHRVPDRRHPTRARHHHPVRASPRPPTGVSPQHRWDSCESSPAGECTGQQPRLLLQSFPRCQHRCNVRSTRDGQLQITRLDCVTVTLPGRDSPTMTTAQHAPTPTAEPSKRPRVIRRTSTSFPVRKIGNDYRDVGAAPDALIPGNPMISQMMCGISMFFPPGERFMIAAAKAVEDQIEEPALRAEIDAFVRQEAQHASEHSRANKYLARLVGLDSEQICREIVGLWEFIEKHASPKLRAGVTAATEHFTAINSEVVLSDLELADSFAEGKAKQMLMWHAIEECEHRAVMFDAHKDIGGSELDRIAIMAVYTIPAVTAGTLPVIRLFAAHGQLTNRAAWTTGLSVFGRRLAWPIFTKYLQYYRPGFHPNHSPTRHLEQYWRRRLNIVDTGARTTA